MAAIELYGTPIYSDTNLVSYYRFEGNSNDSKGSNNGTDTSVSYSSTSGQFTQYGDYNGSAYSDLGTPANLSFNYNSAFSVNFWTKHTSTQPAGGGIVIGKTSVTDRSAAGWMVFLSSTSCYFQLCNNASFWLQCNNTTTSINDGAWRMITVTYSGSHLASGVNFYVNGTAESKGTDQDNLGLNAITNAVAVRIGATSAATQKVTAKLDDLAVFNRVLTATEVSNLYNGTWSRNLLLLGVG